uniref:Bifunctional lysine-specific demethylase and histidyl-hydroxylase n=1 Tax=Daucus carota subsp. sativus TaxID=79200 RepID=A0A162A3N2_DAUCS
MEKQINSMKRKRRKKGAPSSLSVHVAGKNLFGVMSDEIVISSLEIIGAACLYSLELNEKFAIDDEVIKGLINVVGNSKRKKVVALAGCNATLDLSSTSIARRRLLQFSALECFTSQFNQVPKCSGVQLRLYKEEKGSSSCVRIGFKEDKYLILLLHTIVALLNTCTAEQLERIPKNISKILVVYLKSLWVEIQKQMLLGSILKSRLTREFCLSKITPNNLAESIFRLSVNDQHWVTAANHEKVIGGIFDLGETSFECFMLNNWEASPLHMRGHLKSAPHVLYFNDILRCEAAFKEGYSIAMRGMEFRFKSIAAVADDLASFFGQPSVGVNMYLTPPDSQGLACHYDDHCVFVCQLIGTKNWKIFHRPSLQLPRLYEPINKLENEEMTTDRFNQVLLKEGDVLYIPRGVPHEACTVNEDESDGNAGFSLHLTLAIEVEPPFE